MARTVAGTLLLPNGQPLANARIYFVAKRTEAASILEGVNASFSTNASGVYSQSIVNGYYSVSMEAPGDSSGTNPRRYSLGDAFVETAATTTLEALLIASNPPDDTSTDIFYQVLAECQAAAAAASASAVAAASSAASITKVTSQTDVVSGRVLDNRGWMGYGISINLTSANDLLALPGLPTGGNAKYIWSSGSQPVNSPIAGAGYMTREFSGSTFEKLIVHSRDLSWMYVNTKSGSVWSGWVESWNGNNLVKTATFIDTTAGRMTKVGDGGLLTALAGGVVLTGEDLNNWAVSGSFYAVSCTNIPPGTSHGYLEHRNANNAGYRSQTFTSYNSTGVRVFERLCIATVWTLWQESYNTGNMPSSSGTFTPVVAGTATAGSCTYTTQTGRYTRFSDRYDWTINLGWSGHTGTGSLVINAMPFTSAAFSSFAVRSNSVVLGAAGRTIIAANTASSLTLRAVDSAGASETTPAVPASCGLLQISGTIFI